MQFWAELTWGDVAFYAGLFAVSIVVSFLSVAVIMVKIPENYFSFDYEREFLPDKSRLVRLVAMILKNAFGVFLIVLGIFLSLPGVPGQGILTILLGLILTDIPGKRRLETAIVKRPAVFAAINRLRARYKKPPLQTD